MPILFNIFQKPEEEKTQPYLFYEINVCSCSVTELCLTLCDTMDFGLPQRTLWTLACSCIHGIFQARILEWIAISSFKGYS